MARGVPSRPRVAGASRCAGSGKNSHCPSRSIRLRCTFPAPLYDWRYHRPGKRDGPGAFRKRFHASTLLPAALTFHRPSSLRLSRSVSPMLSIFLCIGLAAGVLSGLFGLGGGILIVPALVFLAKFPPRIALGTSLGAL